MSNTHITISPEAADFYIHVLKATGKRGISIKGKVYGRTNYHEGFSVAIDVREPKNPVFMSEEKGVKVFIEKENAWFTEGLDVEIDFDKELEAPTYYFIPNDGREIDTSTGASS